MRPEFDALHSISDLHLGGKPGFQVFDQGALAAGLIDALAGSAGKRVVLVVNGDLVDFLAEEEASYLDPEGAIAKLERISGDPAFEPVFAALGRFVATPGRHLVVTLGNHDVELALPPVRRWLAHRLCGDDPASHGRLTLAFDGSGYACSVAGRSVLCLHGNEVDTWNVVDHRRLLEVSRALNRGQAPPDWTPNAGTKLVVDIMNDVKRDFPFVDLLKPETKPVPAVLLAVDPGIRHKLAAFAPVAVRRIRDAARRSFGFLSADDEPPQVESDATSSLEYMLAGSRHSGRRQEEIDRLLDETEKRVLENADPLDVGSDSWSQGTLGIGDVVADLARGRDPRENLRKTLLAWRGDAEAAFDLAAPDDTFRDVDRAVGDEVDVVLTGHTHLHKALPRANGRGTYFNSGTWIRLIELTDAHLSTEGFPPVFDALNAGRMEALDGLPGLVLRRPTLVSVVEEAGTVYGELRTAVAGAGGVATPPIAGTRREV